MLDLDKDRCMIGVNWDKSNFVLQSDALHIDRYFTAAAGWKGVLLHTRLRTGQTGKIYVN